VPARGGGSEALNEGVIRSSAEGGKSKRGSSREKKEERSIVKEEKREERGLSMTHEINGKPSSRTAGKRGEDSLQKRKEF